MTEVQEETLNRMIPEYESIKREIELYSDYELGLLEYNFPNSVEEFSSKVIAEVQWDISNTVFKPFINNWTDFSIEYEELVMDYCSATCFLKYYENRYHLSKETILSICKEMIEESGDKDYPINEEVDFRDVILELNRKFPPKFCEE